MFTDALTLVDEDCAVFGCFDWAGCCAVLVFDWAGCCAVLGLAVPLFGVCCAWLLAGGLVWACEGGEDPLGWADAGGLLCACEGLVDAAGADWFVVEFAAGADWLVVELEGCVDVVVDCVDVDGCVVVDELEPGVLVCGWAAVGEVLVELFGDCANAAVPNTRQTAVLASICLFMLELLVQGADCTQNNGQAASPFLSEELSPTWAVVGNIRQFTRLPWWAPLKRSLV
jgi:hypothetical protein